MRIRQVRPEFFTDPTMAALAPDVRLTYIGLWIVADDAGFFRRDVAQIGALLYPFESVKRRERHLEAAMERLVEVGRLVCHDCGCGEIPTLKRHQRVTGKQSFSARDAHDKHRTRSGKQSVLSVSPVTLGNGTVGNGNDASLTSEDDGLTEFQRLVGPP